MKIDDEVCKMTNTSLRGKITKLYNSTGSSEPYGYNVIWTYENGSITACYEDRDDIRLAPMPQKPVIDTSLGRKFF